nr:ribonuclease H-like domain-containing protein [Tanacetum cinerariifolium]
MAGSDNDSDNASIYNKAPNNHQQPNIQPQIITTVSNNNAKFPFLKKDEYEVWAMKIEYWITNNDMNIWKVIQNGNSLKRTGRDNDGGLIILPLTIAEEHLVMRKSMLKQEFLEFRISEAEDYTKDVLQSFIADTEPEQQLAYEDLKQIEKLDLEEMDLKWQMTMLSVRVHKFEQKVGRKIDFDKKESAMFNKQKVICYKCQQRGHFAKECRLKGGNDKQRYSSFKIKDIGKKEEDSKDLVTVDTLVDWINHDSESDGVIAAKEFGMIAGCDSGDALKEGTTKLYNLNSGANSEEANTAGDAGEFALMGVTSEVHNCPFGCDNKYNELTKQYNALNEQTNEYLIQDQAYKNSLKTLEKQKRVLQRNQLTLEEKIRVLPIELENTSNLLKHSERINADVETAKKYLQTKLDNHLARTKNENELGWDDSVFSVFTTNSEDVEGRPIFHRFAKTNSMKAVPPPFTGDYTSLSDHTDLDESQMSYGTKPLIRTFATSCPNEAKARTIEFKLGIFSEDEKGKDL